MAPRRRFGALVYTVATLRTTVGMQECTQIGGNGPSAPFRGICVHCCDAICRDVNPHELPKSTQLTQFIEYPGICRALHARPQKTRAPRDSARRRPRTSLAGRRRPALPRTRSAVPSALGGLTSGFGMGPGVPPLPWPPTSEGRSLPEGPAWRRALRAAQRDSRRRSQGDRRDLALGKRRARPISAARLSASRRLHLRPITSWSTRGLTEGRTHLGTGFPLRCFQRLSQPDSATGRCRWSTTRAPEVRPPRSSRTRGSLPQFSYARGG